MAYNILIVDDSSTVRGMVKKVLDLTQVPIGKMVEAKDGQQALEILETQWIDLILADLNMPRMTGREMVDIISVTRKFSKIPVIVISSEGNESIIEELKNKGVKEIIRKPFEPGFLRKTLRNALGMLNDRDEDE